MTASSADLTSQRPRAVTTYVPQIDGLRAIAVLAVILYHADARLVPGGYLGVDIFFVISGYLITSLIATDLAHGTFSLSRFYERRVRRILPALFLVLAATVPFAALYLLPSQQRDYANSLLSTLLFSSNIQFWLETGYFMPEADLKPLLHTWSLAVEEQYYLLYPLLLAALWRVSPKVRGAALVTLFGASLVGSALLAQTAPGANFFLLPSRAWELLAGAFLALSTTSRPQAGCLNGPLALLGLAMVLGSLALFDQGTPMPSFWGLIPVGGTVLLIGFARGSTLVGRLLALRPLVGVGLVSYSAYLWHWPILVFWRLRFGYAVSPGLLAGLIAATFVLSYLSWRFVEKPARRHGQAALVPMPALVGVLVVVAAGLVSVTILPGTRVLARNNIAEDALDPSTPAGIEAKIAPNHGLSELCEGSFTLAPECRTSDTPEVLLWGDSFSMHLARAIEAGSGRRGMIQHTKSVCTAIVDLAVVTPEYPAAWSNGCIAFNDQVLDWLAGQPSIRYVVMSSHFQLIYGYDLYQRGGAIFPAPNPELVREKLLATAARIRAMGKTFVIVSPPPATGENIGQCLARAALRGAPEDACDFTTTQIHPFSAGVYNFLRGLSSEIPVVFLDEVICRDGVCDTRVGDIFIFRDDGHLSIEASRYLGVERALYHSIQLAGAP